MSDSKIELSQFERLILVNQMRILEALYPDDAESIAVQREAIEHGYEMFYRWQMEHIYTGGDVMTAEESIEVWDTFDMFDAINRAIEKYDKPEYREHFAAKFSGYDGNNESKFMAFAAYTVERLKRFEYVPLSRPGHWNSHCPMRDVYGRMLQAWKTINRERRFELSESELKAILSAAVHPDNRHD